MDFCARNGLAFPVGCVIEVSIFRVRRDKIKDNPELNEQKVSAIRVQRDRTKILDLSERRNQSILAARGPAVRIIIVFIIAPENNEKPNFRQARGRLSLSPNRGYICTE
jgi:hypothetical protein